MAKGKGGSNSNSNERYGGGGGGFAQIQFINLSPTEAQKIAFGQWLSTEPDIWLIVDDVISSEFKVSVSYDKKSDAVMATITNKRQGDPFCDHCFTLRARSSWEALARVLWFHAVFAEGDWGAFAHPSADSDVW